MKYINEYNTFKEDSSSHMEKAIELFIFNLIKDLEVKNHEGYPHSTFFVHKDTGKAWMVDNKKTEILYVSYSNIWSKIQSSFPDNYLNIADIIKRVVETTFKLRVGTPRPFQPN